MKITCNVIKDLLPMYVENLTSKASDDCIKTHLESCLECQKEYNRMIDNNFKTAQTDISLFEDANKALKKQNKKTIIVSVILVFLALFLIDLRPYMYVRFYSFTLQIIFDLFSIILCISFINLYVSKFLEYKFKKRLIMLEFLVGIFITSIFPLGQINNPASDPFNQKARDFVGIENVDGAWAYSSLLLNNQTIVATIYDGGYMRQVEFSKKEPLRLRKYDFTNLTSTVIVDGLTFNYTEYDEYILFTTNHLEYNVYGHMDKSYFGVEDIKLYMNDFSFDDY